LKQHNSTTDN